jgi:hypothetical protein
LHEHLFPKYRYKAQSTAQKKHWTDAGVQLKMEVSAVSEDGWILFCSVVDASILGKKVEIVQTRATTGLTCHVIP